MRILYNSKDTFHKSPFGCLRQGEGCTLTVLIPTHCQTVALKLDIRDENGFQMVVPFKLLKTENDYEHYSCSFALFGNGLYFYCFRVQTKEGDFCLYKQGNDTNIGEGDLWQLTCFDSEYDTPEEFKGKVMYQIFPDRFFKSGKVDLSDKLKPYVIHENCSDTPVFMPDGNGKIINNDFFGGNLKGICEKLPYLKELGVGIIYLNPIFMAFSNHRYDTADYKRIDPLLGDENDFKKLCDSAHKLGIKVILDGVFSHTGSNSIYFDKDFVFGNGAVSNPQSPYKDWFMFQSYPHKYTSWWGIDTLPCVDEMNSSYMDYIIFSKDSVIEHWLNAGADGFRLDVADELPDEFIYAFKKRLKQIKPDALLIGEVWEDASNKISYGKRRKYFSDGELDSVMNYPFKDAVLSFIKGYMSGDDFSEKIMDIVENYPKPVLDCVMNILSTHDTRRVLTELSDADFNMSKAEKAQFRLEGDMLKTAISRQKAAAVLQFTLPGSPCIYYGDESGTEGFEDPLNRTFFRWDCINEELFEFYKKLAHIKNTAEPLKYGDISFSDCTGKHIGFSRFYNGKRIFTEISLSGSLPHRENELLRVDENGVCAVIFN